MPRQRLSTKQKQIYEQCSNWHNAITPLVSCLLCDLEYCFYCVEQFENFHICQGCKTKVKQK